MTFADKIAVVTGAASGIGEAIAQGLVACGARVAALDIHPAKVGTAIICDLGSDVEVVTVAGRITAEIGVPDILIHCAATTFKGPVLDTPIADFERIMNLNLYGALRLTNAFAPAMRSRGSSRVRSPAASGPCAASAPAGCEGRWPQSE